MLNKIKSTALFLKEKHGFEADTAIILGTGLGGLVNEIEIEKTIAYDEIPDFPVSTVEGHAGRLIKGKVNGKTILAMQGRFHYYEGYSMDEVTFYVRVISLLGIKKLIISNATGSVNPNIDTGDIVLIKDHINLQPVNPLRGLNDPRLGNRFPAMDKVYDAVLLSKTTAIAQREGYNFHTGVYVGLQGPSLETAAEYKYLGIIGGDVVGMSTVPEVIVAAQCELAVLCISVCTNNPFNGNIATTIEEVLEVAHRTGEKIRVLIKTLLKEN